MKLSNEVKNRVIELGRTVWNGMTNEEQEAFARYGDGTIGLVEDVLYLLCINAEEVDYEEITSIHDCIIQ